MITVQVVSRRWCCGSTEYNFDVWWSTVKVVVAQSVGLPLWHNGGCGSTENNCKAE